jgi:hypothetical protein
MSISGKKAIYEEIRLPATRFRGLSAETIERHHCMLYSLYETEFDIRILHVEEQIKAVCAERAAAAQLGVREGTPLLAIERVAILTRNRQSNCAAVTAAPETITIAIASSERNPRKQTMIAGQRPKHLNLFKIRLPLPGLVSFLHRISGAGLFLFGWALLYLLQLSLSSAESHVQFTALTGHWLVKLF